MDCSRTAGKVGRGDAVHSQQGTSSACQPGREASMGSVEAVASPPQLIGPAPVRGYTELGAGLRAASKASSCPKGISCRSRDISSTATSTSSAAITGVVGHHARSCWSVPSRTGTARYGRHQWPGSLDRPGTGSPFLSLLSFACVCWWFAILPYFSRDSRTASSRTDGKWKRRVEASHVPKRVAKGTRRPHRHNRYSILLWIMR